MNRNILSATAFLLICLIGFTLIPTYKFKPYHKPQKKVPKRDRMDQAWLQEKEMTLDPELGEVPRQRLLAAYEYKQRLLNNIKGKAAIAGVNWVERGPNNCGGRTRAILVDLNDATRKTVWAGSVAGGLWKTNDISLANPVWTNQDDFFDNMAITCITQAPGNPQVLYFSTGEGNGNIDAVRGLGIWKSINGGLTWFQLSATNNSIFYYNQRVFTIGNGDIVFAATQNGLYRSINGGTSFTKVLGSGISSAGGNEAEDIERMANGTLYATMAGSGSTSGTIHKSYNNGATWTTPLSNSSTGREIELAVTDVDTNVVWGIVESNSTIKSIIRSTNAGVSFSAVSSYPTDADNGIPATDFSRTQAWYDLSIAADPNNTDVCYVGGIDLFKTVNGGTSWQQVSHWYGGFGFQEVHADQHIAIFEPGNSNVIYFGNDGGVYRSSNATANIPTITSKEFNYRSTQFYACDAHPSAGSNHMLAGAQDNGSHRFTLPGINSTSEVTGGDGAYCHIDQNQPTYQFTAYVYNSFYRSTNGGASFSGSGLTFGTSTGRFVNPSDYDDSLNIMYSSYGNGSFLRWSNPQTGNTTSTITVTALNSVMPSAIKVSPNNVGRIYIGTSGGRVVRLDAANTVTGTTAGVQINSGSGMSTGGYVNCIEVEKGNENHIIVVLTNYGITNVWETLNGGTNWTGIDGNLPDMPIRWALLNPTNNQQLLVATELGVWSTDFINGSSTNWQPSNSGLSNTRVDMLKLRDSDKMVFAATHGRGLFSSNVFTPPTADFYAGNSVVYPNTTIQFNSASTKATSYFWQFGDGTTSTLQNPTKTYTTGGFYNVTLSINSGAASVTKNAFVKVLPYRGVPYLANQGGNFDVITTDFASITTSGTGFELGSSSITGKNGTYTPSNAWVTGLTANYVDNSEAYLYSPSFNCAAAGNYTISFYTKYKTEATYDGFRLEYTTNNGASWLPLGTTIASNWYDYANTSTGRPFPLNEAYFCSSTTLTNFTQKTFTTNIFAGQSTVAFRFVFKADASTTNAGVVIDNFELNGPLNQSIPVKLLQFAAKRADNDVELNWLTATEKNNKGFQIYRKNNQQNTWELIHEMNVNGNSAQTKSYHFTDKNIGDDAQYYRLKQLDIDGAFTWSDVVAVGPKLKTTSNIAQVLTKGDKTFGIKLTESSPAQLWIYNNQGQVVKTLSVNEQFTQLNLNELRDGIYYLHIAQENKQQVIKLSVF